MNRRTAVIAGGFLAAILILLIVGHFSRGTSVDPKAVPLPGSTSNQARITLWDPDTGPRFEIVALLKEDSHFVVFGKTVTQEWLKPRQKS